MFFLKLAEMFDRAYFVMSYCWMRPVIGDF